MSEVTLMCQRLEDIGTRYWQDTHEAITEELDFFDGKHFASNGDRHNKNRQTIEYVGQESYNVIRHKSAQVTAWPRHVQARPLDREVDPVTAELAVALVEWETNNPLKMFDDYCDIVVTGAIAARSWLMGVDYEPTIGPWGEIVFRPIDPRHVIWEPGFHSPHDLMCGWMREQRRVTMAWLKKQKDWTIPETLKPDADTRESSKGDDPEFPADRGDEAKVTINIYRFKHDMTTIDSDSAEPAELGDDERYMKCAACGWTSDAAPGLPDAMTCPKCGEVAERVDAVVRTSQYRKYPDGRRVIVTSPGCEEALYDGPWEVPGLRSFPVIHLTDYLHPCKPTGPSDTLLNWSGQLMADLLMTTAGQRVLDYRAYYLMPELGINDADGKRFEFNPAQGNVMYYRDAMNPSSVQTLMGSQLDPSWNIYWRSNRETLMGSQGISDLGLGPQSSKDIAASTVQQLTQMGEIPVEHLKRRWHRELGRAYGLIWDFIRATYTAGRMARLNLTELTGMVSEQYGQDALVKVFGDELPNYDFVITDGAGLMGLDKTRAESMQMLVAGAQLPPEAALLLLSEVNHVPPTTLRRVQEAMARAKAEAQQQMEQQMQFQTQQMEMQGQQKMALQAQQLSHQAELEGIKTAMMSGGPQGKPGQAGSGAR